MRGRRPAEFPKKASAEDNLLLNWLTDWLTENNLWNILFCDDVCQNNQVMQYIKNIWKYWNHIWYQWHENLYDQIVKCFMAK